ncbi:Hypp9210 [Branchiostoma lanceolatum]|uniref:Hypp9210 protein n=1 Tax=Branchiostoma lanceolatum TaxID=7740 RepID=A0A8J9ZCK8_BRALA|nr:Hypp9210 [Branchiostoma lanceolatum]
MKWLVLALVLTAFISQQSSTAGSVVTRRPTRSVPCLVDADCLVFQTCSWDVTGPTGICLARKKLIRRAALNQKPTNSRSLQRATATPPVKSKTASKRFKHDTSAYQPETFPTIDNHGIAPSSGPTEEHSSEGRDDWRSHVTTFREDSTDEEIVLDNSKDVNYSATAGGRFHGVSDENREDAGNHQTGGQNVEHIKQQIANLRGLLDSPRKASQSDGVHVEQHHKERLPNIPTGNPVVYDPILKEPTGVEDDVDELDVGSPRGDKKDYF